MSDEEIRKIIDDTYDSSREDTLRGMIGTFYSRKLRSLAVFVWVWGLLFTVGAVYCAVKFFGDIDTKAQIMYAALFVSLWFGVGLMKIFAWQVMHRHGIKREIKRLELRMAELSEMVRGGS